ncbi:MAG TPA: FAD-dependent monooxygenase [Candidatus Stackebrandtia excrementipullorum]|nr:FAD-dependent monooxygenase [Candidatus Stackebrandtia excrementipullorum]
MGSTTRDLVIGDDTVSGYDTGWGGWITWGDPADEQDLGEELWGRGFFLGTYPVKDRLGVILGGHRDDTAAGAAAFVHMVRDRLTTVATRTEHALKRIVDNDEKYYWPLFDRRSTRWAHQRVVLLGDAAAGFLPTAGIGACMAIESAEVLARHLRYATGNDLLRNLAEYERRQRPRVEAAQNNARSLARLMFNSSLERWPSPVTWQRGGSRQEPRFAPSVG